MTSKPTKAEETPLLGICEWGKYFETSRTRRVESLNWIRLTVKADSDGYLRFIDVDDGVKRLALFGAWTALIKVAARCNPRGVLVRDGTVALTPGDIARRSGMGSEAAPVISEAIKRAQDVGWLTPLTVREVALMREQESASHAGDKEDSGGPQGGQEEDGGRSLDGHSVVTPRSLDGHSVVTPRSTGGQPPVTPRSVGGHSPVTSVGSNGHLSREDFETIWLNFPKSRRMDKEKCFSLCAAHVKAGKKVAELAEATGRYTKAVEEAGTPVKFIQLAKTFFSSTGRVLDAMEPDFIERFVAQGDGASTKPKQQHKPGTLWAEIYGEEYPVIKAERTGKLKYFTHGDWHEVPEGTKVHKA